MSSSRRRTTQDERPAMVLVASGRATYEDGGNVFVDALGKLW
jgi:hypothetical protein